MGNSEPPISVIVPTYNRSKLLKRCLESLQAQILKPREIIVVDDGSTDGTDKVVKTLMEDAPVPIRYFRQQHGGPSRARNLGVEHAAGEWLAFFDDDQVAPPFWLERLTAGQKRYSQAQILAGPVRLRFLGPSPKRCPRCHFAPLGEVVLPKVGLLDRPEWSLWPGSGNLLCLKALFDQIGGFREDLEVGEDNEWCFRAVRAGAKIATVPEAWVDHLRDPAAVWNTKALFARGVRSIRAKSSFAPGGITWTRLFQELAWGMKMGGHALFGGCAAGYVDAISRFGRAWGILQEKLHAHRL